MSAREPLPAAARGERVGPRRDRAARIMQLLRRAYPDARCALHHEDPFQLLVATILSAQCTDARVNQVTPALFDAFPTPEAMADADLDELEELVRSTGFFRQKAKNIRATAAAIAEAHDGLVPETVDELAGLPGAARKTANVVVSNCFPENAEGIAVDTHVQRVVRRLGLVTSWEPPKVERELMRLLPDRTDWNDLTHLVIDHGRAVCRAPVPDCGSCPLRPECPSAGRWQDGRPLGARGRRRRPAGPRGAS